MRCRCKEEIEMDITLGMIFKRVPGAKLTGSADAVIKDIVQDSREATPGTLFVAMEGLHVDGHKFIAGAVAGGAVAVLTTRSADKAGAPEG